MRDKKVYILLTDTGTVFTRLIKLYTKKQYNHASICFDSELTEVYSFGRKTARNPFIGGFVKEDMKKGLFKRANCVIYSFKTTESEIQKMKQYINEIEEQKESYRYNFLGLFGVMFNKSLKRKKAFFCSQFVATVLSECTDVCFDKPLSLIAPNDLQKIGSLRFEYQGKLTSYPTINVEKIKVPACLIPA